MPETRKRPGPAPKISREAVLDAARELAPDEVTLAAIGAKLGVTGPALYRYFEDRAAILEALANEAREKLVPPDSSLPWEEWIRHAATKERSLWVNHPDLYEAANYRAISKPALRMTIEGTRKLIESGFTAIDAVTALTVISETAHAIAWAEHHTGGESLFEPSDLEELIPFMREYSFQGFESLFAECVELVIDGLQVRAARRK